MRKLTFKKPKHLKIILIGFTALFIMAGGIFWRQNALALHQLHAAEQQDKDGKVTLAKASLAHTPHWLVLPATQRKIVAERHKNQMLIATNEKIAEVQKLIKEHKPAQALALLKTIQPAAGGGTSTQTQQSQISILTQNAQKSVGSTTSSSSSNSGSTSGTTSGGNGGTTGGSGGGGASGGSGGGGTTTPPGPMTAITIATFTATSSARNASSCNVNQSVGFSVDGSGSVNVTWKIISTKSSSEIGNPVAYSFTAAGNQTDSLITAMQGLEPGDSYHVSVTIVDQSNGSIIASAGPTTLSSCAAPPALLAAQQPSFMTQITPGTLSVSQSPDGLFPNECSMNLSVPFSVDGSGSVQAVYTLTSGSSGGASLYAITTEDFSTAGSDHDNSYIRMPHLNSGDSYSISVKLIDVGNQTVYATAGPISSGCS